MKDTPSYLLLAVDLEMPLSLGTFFEDGIQHDSHITLLDSKKELDKDKLSFNFTIRVPLNYSSLHGWEDLGISTLKIDTINTKEKDGKIIVTSFNVYPVIDNTTM